MLTYSAQPGRPLIVLPQNDLRDLLRKDAVRLFTRMELIPPSMRQQRVRFKQGLIKGGSPHITVPVCTLHRGARHGLRHILQLFINARVRRIDDVEGCGAVEIRVWVLMNVGEERMGVEEPCSQCQLLRNTSIPRYSLPT